VAEYFIDKGGQMSGLAYTMEFREDRMVRGYQLDEGDKLHANPDLAFIITYIACSNLATLTEKKDGAGRETWAFTFPAGGHHLADLGSIHTGAGIRLKPDTFLTTTAPVFVLGYQMPA
jgi:hypothetical protein